MTDTLIGSLLAQLRGGLIVSCQAPTGSPLNDPYIISAMALAAEQHGAVAVRIKHADQIAATRARVQVPVIGLDKVEFTGSPVYITPTFAIAERLAASGADFIATDATQRPRPGGETLAMLMRRIQHELHKPVLADVATLDEGLHAADCGADFIATTLCGYTAESAGASLPAFSLLEKLAKRLTVPVICEGGVSTPEEVHQAFDCGAFAVVVGTAITGMDKLIQPFITASRRAEA